ncbi:aldo/keto reductase [Erysipelothrix aquatica]|uniref:aldo/keto reductase n=1 Tax=Erysipelothrix aquatica TaxID=2683714 RepID=UPI0013598C78|nr:aldo/keto reductase [Erysipelothrix aquatica]
MLYQTLNNGVSIPVLGLGTYKLTGEDGLAAIMHAIQTGYRHIDTASYYDNEFIIGTAVKNSGVPRSEFFLTSKVWETDQGYDATLQAFERTLANLQTDYLDLYLIHWPHPLSKATWRALEHLYKQGKVKAIGVSNFSNHQLEVLMEDAVVMPMVNQLERHPYMIQAEAYAYNYDHGIIMEAWRPLLRGALEEEPILVALSQKYGKSVSQIVLRWQIQTGFVVFPKSANVHRQAENFDVFDFELAPTECDEISSLHKENSPESDIIIGR